MASFTLAQPHPYPPGSTVGAYFRTDEGVHNSAPGTTATTAVVQNDGRLTFTGLTYNTKYWAAASVGGVWQWTAFTADPGPSGEGVANDDSRLSDPRTPTGPAGGALAGTYPNPSLAVDVATQAELDTVSTARAATQAALTAHEAATTFVHGIADTSLLATKAYADGLALGLSWKDSVKAASTANVALTGTQTIDGVALVATDRVLLKNQTAGAENGIWVVAAGAWARSADADSAAELAGMVVFVQGGTVHANQTWALQTQTFTLGTTPLTFAQTGAGGTGVPNDGSVTDAKVAAGAAIAESKLNLASDAAAGTASRRTLGTGALQAAAGNHAHAASAVTVTPAGSMASTNVQAALEEAFTELGGGGLLINAQTGATYSLALADATKLVTRSNTAQNMTRVPPNSEVAFPVGTQILIASLNVGLAQIVGAGTTFGTEAFTDTAGVLLENHAGSLVWTAVSTLDTGMTISSAGRVYSQRPGGAADDAIYWSSGLPASADYDVQATVTQITDPGAVAAIGVAGRMSETVTTGYFAHYNADNGTYTLEKAVAGAYTNLGSYVAALGNGNSATLKLEIRDATKKVYVDGIERISSADNAITAVGRAGIWAYGISTNTTGAHLDTWTAVNKGPLVTVTSMADLYTLAGKGATASLIKLDTDTWLLSGRLA